MKEGHQINNKLTEQIERRIDDFLAIEVGGDDTISLDLTEAFKIEAIDERSSELMVKSFLCEVWPKREGGRKTGER